MTVAVSMSPRPGTAGAAAGALLLASGVLMAAASRERWGGACSGSLSSDACTARQDHLFDFVAPSAPWEPVGNAAQLAGLSLLALALGLVLLALLVPRRRPAAMSLLGMAAVMNAVAGVATLFSGLAGEVVQPPLARVVTTLWLVLTPVAVGWWGATARGWSLVAAVPVVVSTPLAAALTYAIGPFDARPWWEAVSGAFIVVGGLFLLVGVASRHPRGRQPQVRQPAAVS
ncbi:MAG: hypothetical protein R2731_13375 [Nocardioides sp.]